MARKKPARPATRNASRKAPKKGARRKAASRPIKKASAKPPKRSAKRSAKKAVTKAVKRVVKVAPVAKAKVVARKTSKPARTPNLDRPRRTVADIHDMPSSLGEASMSSAARSGRSDMMHKLAQHTSSSPALTAGDVDADWASADSTGDEAPGGDNPTPDQDVVDEIGRALGVEYHDDEELQGGDEIAERDRHRWELDPSSKDEFDEKE